METKAVGFRLPAKLLHQLSEVGEEQSMDRSTAARLLLDLGLKEYRMEKAEREYRKGNLTASHAAKLAGMTLWEFEQYLVSRGFKSEYSTEDLRKELALLH